MHGIIFSAWRLWLPALPVVVFLLLQLKVHSQWPGDIQPSAWHKNPSRTLIDRSKQAVSLAQSFLSLGFPSNTNNSISDMGISSAHFRVLQSFTPDYSPNTITQYESTKTGMRVVVVDQKGPKLYGYFVLATEI